MRGDAVVFECFATSSDGLICVPGGVSAGHFFATYEGDTASSYNRTHPMAFRFFLFWLSLLTLVAVPGAGVAGGRVAVVSLLGDVFPATYIGATAMSKRTWRTRVAPWRLDDYARGVAAAAIEREDAFDYVDFRPNRKAFLRLYTDEFRLLDDSHYDVDNVAGLVRALRAKYGVDTLVLIIADRVSDPIEETSLTFGGYGLYRNDFIGDRSYLYSFFKVLVIDTGTLAERARATAAAYTKIDGRYWGAGLNKLSRTARRALRDTTESLLARHVPAALADAGLIARTSVAAPAGGAGLPPEGEVEEIEFEVSYVAPGEADADVGAARRVAGGYGAAARRAFIILDGRRAFYEYTLEHVKKRLLRRGENAVLYRDVCRAWVADNFRWPVVGRRVIAMYRRLGFSAPELAEIADFGASSAGAKLLKNARFSNEQRKIWRAVATAPRLKRLAAAVAVRRDLIRREARTPPP